MTEEKLDLSNDENEVFDEIKVGDKVKSFDFKGIDSAYIQGEVTGFEIMEGCKRYVIKTEKRIFDGKEIALADDHPEKTVYPPVNGTPSFLGKTNLVKLI